MEKTINRIAFFTFIIISNVSKLNFSQETIYFEFENRISFIESGTKMRPEVNVYGEVLEDQKMVGAYFYALSNDKWGEAYGGLLYKPFDYLVTNFGIGVEIDDNPYRLNAGALMNMGDISFSQWYEYGGSGFWYNITFNYKLLKEFQAGLIYKRYYGLGLNLWFIIPETFLSFNIAPLYDFENETTRFMGIIRFTF